MIGPPTLADLSMPPLGLVLLRFFSVPRAMGTPSLRKVKDDFSPEPPRLDLPLSQTSQSLEVCTLSSRDMTRPITRGCVVLGTRSGSLCTSPQAPDEAAHEEHECCVHASPLAGITSAMQFTYHVEL
jgi:hypothetical protein